MNWLVAILMHPITLISLGGAAGSNARYWIGLWFRAQPWAQEYTWGTFVINVSGSLLLGVVAAVFKDRAGPGFLLLGTGFCGGYTTFSTFSLEVAEAIQKGRWDLAGLYAGTSVLGGLIAFAAAAALVRTND
jgi:fluoride exporter